jgi:hypothetical protein
MLNALWTALYGRLSGGTALTALLGGTAIYHNQAPEGAALPYVIYNWQGGGYVQDSPHTDANGIVTVQAFSRISQAQAGSISEVVLTLLNRSNLTVTGYSNFGLTAEAPHLQNNYTDESGLNVYSCGDQYRIMIDKT